MKKIVQFAIILFLVSGCKKALELDPLDTISDATFYKTANDFKMGANGLYNSLPGFDFSDTESDIAFNTANSVSDGTYLPPETSSSWNNAFYYIRNANNLIEKSADKTDPAIKMYVAEAKFFRAWNYWSLLRLFGGVPLIINVLSSDDPRLYTARATRKETVDLIIKDLKEAAADLPVKSAIGAANRGRIAKGTADALRARVALFEGTWSKYHQGSDASNYLQEAVDAADAVMSSGEYALYTDKGAQSYRYLFIEEGDDSRETILDRRYEVNLSGQGYPYSIDATCYLPTRKLADMYLSKDGLPITASPLFQGYGTVESEYKDRDPRMTMTMIIPGTATLRPFYALVPQVNWPTSPQRNGNTGYITYKYISENVFGNTNNGVNFGFDRHIIRYAEVLLIFAEASFEKNGALTDAEMDRSINLLRQRVNMPAMTNAVISTNLLDLKTEIRRERNVELALEGFRYDDIRRWKTAEVEMTQSILGIKIAGTAWAGIAPYSGAEYQSRVDANGFLISQPASARHFDPAKHYLRPLPTREIRLYDGVLEQNENWQQ